MASVAGQLNFSGAAALSDPATPATDGPSDDALVAALRGGDGAAAEQLVRRYHEPLLRFLARATGSPQRAEELVQQTWLSVLQHLDQFRCSDPAASLSFRAWLFRIAANKGHDLWRSQARERAAYEGLRWTGYDAAAPDASAAPDGAEQADRLRRAIDALPEPQRQVVLMRYYGGLRFHEIAELLGCPLNTALGRMHKAMQKLRRALEAEGEPIVNDGRVGRS